MITSAVDTICYWKESVMHAVAFRLHTCVHDSM